MNFSNFTWIDYLGLFGAFLSAITFIPQVIQAYKTKSVRDLNTGMLFIIFSSVCVWLIYGFVKQDLPIIVANSVILILCSILLYFKATFK
ncbi:MAG: SemiSWEET family sugar transporter [Chitinophagaceae bacterium]|jgi:MtN3 and saliva related transmembrane protein